MRNVKTVINENGETINIEIILAFEVQEFKKKYIAYTINDNDEEENAVVLISEIDYSTNKLKSINFNEKEAVMQVYEEMKKVILNVE